MNDVEAGQLWRRKKDGLLIRIVNIGQGDCYWESVEGKKRGNIYAVYLPDRYDLETE